MPYYLIRHHSIYSLPPYAPTESFINHYALYRGMADKPIARIDTRHRITIRPSEMEADGLKSGDLVEYSIKKYRREE